MKALFSCLMALWILAGCSSESDKPIPASALLLNGSWVEREAFISAGGPQFWVDVEAGETITFFRDGTFRSDRFSGCAEGTYALAENELLLDYACRDFIPPSANEAGVLSFTLELFENYFILTPTSGPICIEGCSYKYFRE